MGEELKYSIEKSKREDNYTIAFEKGGTRKYALSKYAPYREAEKLIPEDKGNKQTVWFIFGFAMGHIVRCLLEMVQYPIQVVVVEPTQEMLEAQLNSLPDKEYFDKPNIHFLSGELNIDFRNKMSSYIPDCEIDNIRTISIPVYLDYFFEYYRETKDIAQNILMDKLVEINTGNSFGHKFIANVVKNRKQIAESYALSELKGRFKGVPAVIVSAGPSLEKNIHLLKEFKGIIVVGNRSLKAVLEQGIKPDYIMAADPQDIVYETLNHAEIDDEISMVVLDTANDKFIGCHNGKKYFVNTYANSKRLLGVNTTYGIGFGGSVATLCTSVMQYIGCDPIIFIGQDLAFTGGKFHADSCDISGKNQIEEKQNELTTKGYYGDKVSTSYQFISYIHWFENFIKDNKQCTFINATQGGAYIEGAVHKDFAEVVDEYKDFVKPDLHQYDQKVTLEQDMEERIDKIIDTLKEMCQWAYKGVIESNKLKAEYSGYKKVRVDKIRKICRALDKIDEKLSNDSIVSDITAHIFSTLDMKAQRNKDSKEQFGEDERQEGLRIADYSLNLYSNIEQACKEYIDVVNENR